MTPIRDTDSFFVGKETPQILLYENVILTAMTAILRTYRVKPDDKNVHLC